MEIYYKKLNLNKVILIGIIVITVIIAAGCATPEPENLIEKTKDSELDQSTSVNRVAIITKQKIVATSYVPTIQIQTKSIKTDKALPGLYSESNNTLYWIDFDGPTSNAYEMIEIVKNSSDEALNPKDYNLEEIESTLDRLDRDKASGNSYDQYDLAELELLMSNAFLKYAHDMYYGRVRAEKINLDLDTGEKPVNLAQLIVESTSNNTIQISLDSLKPKYPVYGQLKTALKQYREIAKNGGWQKVPYGGKFEKGARGAKVVALRERLKVTGDLDPSTPNSDVFDKTLDIAVKGYQERNGLYVDGVVGDSTIEALNVTVEERIAQIELTLERWRLLPQNLGSKYILVNIANFHLYGVENNNDLLNMRIVVGKPEWNTPMFSEEMTHIVMNPYWNIPPSIFRDDIAPRIRQDSQYLSKRGIDAVGLNPPKKIKVQESEKIEVAENVKAASVVGIGKNGEQQLSETEVQNQKAQEEYISKVLSGKYRLRQNPGPGNPLGQIKFLFPNKHSVYLHDTPNRGFFKRAQRNFSHGCIRVEKPIDLAEFVLKANGEWDQNRIQSSINSRKTRTVHLNQTIPVYVLYFTAWVDEQGNVNFHKDIYGQDKTLQNALRSERPSIDMATSVIQ